MTKSLTVWWDETIVGQMPLNEYGEPFFQYAPEWLRAENCIAISVSLPLQEEAFSWRKTLPFFEGLLPEESQLRAASEVLGISDKNVFGLLEALGGDVAGALSLWPSGKTPPAAESSAPTVLSPDAFIKILDELPYRPMLAGKAGMRLSLAGAQSKLPIIFEVGNVALPGPGQPTTHIIKPPITRFEGTTENEAFCMRLAHKAELPVAPIDILTINERSCLLVERYDRMSNAEGAMTRLHQEDFCQALGYVSSKKYTADGGPRLKDCFNLIRSAATRPARDVLGLVDAVIFNIIIGNADAHSKNFSLIYSERGISLAPLYDLLSTVSYPELSSKFAMKIAKRATLEELQPKDIQTLAEDTGLTAPYIRRRIQALGSAVISAAPAVHEGFDLTDTQRGFMRKYENLVSERAQKLMVIATQS